MNDHTIRTLVMPGVILPPTMSSTSTTSTETTAPVPTQADVVVIGGGPAGTTTAALLAARGRRVILFERDHFPRHHVGESMLPASLPILDALGVKEAIDKAGFIKKWGAAMVWGQDRELWSWYFRETNGPYEHAYQVPRAEFDHLLLQNARLRGVDAREGHRVTRVLFDGDRAVGVAWEADTGESGEVSAAMVVDASGQLAMLSTRLDLREWDGFFRNLAVYGYFPGIPHMPAPDDGSILIESFEHGWLWKIPLHTGESSIGAVVDSEFGQARLREVTPEAFLLEQIALSPKTREMVGNTPLKGSAYIVKDWSYLSKRMTGEGYVLAGDAACFIDPLFSSGVHLAMQAGLMAAAYVHTVLKDPSLRIPAGQEYEGEYRRRYGYFHELARLFYGSNAGVDSDFWRERRLDHMDWTDAPRRQFINLVSGHPPAGYERVVIDRGNAPEGFASRLAALEGEQESRRGEAEALAARTGPRGEPAILDAKPKLAKATRITRKMVLTNGEYVWGQGLETEAAPYGIPIIPPVAQLLTMLNGKTTVGEAIRRMRASVPREHHAEVQRSVIQTVIAEYASGAIEALGAPAS